MTEQLLTGAGFQKKVADTPEKLAHLGTLTPARRLVAHQRDDQLYYVYADPAMCECLYVRTPAQYQRVLEKRLANEAARRAAGAPERGCGHLGPLWAPWPGF